MPVSIKTPEEIEKMRVAGRLASEVLDYITPFIQAGVTTGEIDHLCHEYMVNIQQCIPCDEHVNYCLFYIIDNKTSKMSLKYIIMNSAYSSQIYHLHHSI